MTPFLTNIMLALTWVALTGEFLLSNFLVGLILGYALLWVSRTTTKPSQYFFKTRRAISLVFFLLWELTKANLRVAYDVMTPRHHMRPGIIAIPLDVRSDSEITLLANLITLTPGTLSLDISPDRRVLYVHTMYLGGVDAFRRSVKEGFEHRIKEIFQ